MKKALALIPCCLILFTGVMGNLNGKPTEALAQRGGRGNDDETRWRIRLRGPVFNGRSPQGNAEWRVRGNRTGLKVEASNIALADGSLLTVKLNGAAIGAIRLTLGRGELEFRSQDGTRPPTVQRGDVVTVWAGDTQVLSGSF
jgi:hypothetical protein